MSKIDKLVHIMPPEFREQKKLEKKLKDFSKENGEEAIKEMLMHANQLKLSMLYGRRK